MGQDLNKKQLVLLITAAVVFIVGGFLSFRWWRDPSKPTSLPGRMTFVDVATGERLSVDLDTIRAIPAKNPRTGQRTLLPCGQNPEGRWVVDGHYREAVVAGLAEVNKYVDPNTLEVKDAP